MRQYLLIFSAALLLGPVKSIAQVSFVIPSDSIIDYAQYDRIETCQALSHRLHNQLSNKKDSIAYKSEIFLPAPVDTTKPLRRWSVGQCMKKFDIASIAQQDSVTRGQSVRDTAMRLYYVGKQYDRFRDLVDRIMRSENPKDSLVLGVVRKWRIVKDIVRYSVQPADDALLDSLEDQYVVSVLLKYPDDIFAVKEYYEILFSRVKRIDDDSTDVAIDRYKAFIAKAQEEVFPKPKFKNDSSAPMIRLRHLVRMAYDRINYQIVLDSLRVNGPDGYFHAYQINHEMAGLKGEREFRDGVAQKMPNPEAFIVYRQGQNPWKAPIADTIPVNTEFSMKGPYVQVWLNALCREEMMKTGWAGLREAAPNNGCRLKYEWIKWFGEKYPDIPIVIYTSTTGHYDERAITDPYQEAEYIKNGWWEFHKLPANILIYYVNYFNLQGIDQRREDALNTNEEKYIQATNQHRQAFSDPLRHISLVVPDGRILATLPYRWNGAKGSAEVLDAFQAWYKNSKKQRAAAE